ncbi:MULTISPECIES: aspartate--tRNA ligase [unclassified Geobacillus]|uniref:Aspartate--tRNA(Asp/Asn) ligase n=1 Tax=Geobacillus sp. (strain WCH70) TaxID=471223 RepID=SYDND_GEOSW|nr:MULTISPECIES: aspartate--tRNA ligase [unclassified Geobacillus]C5D509.1 RecName: Full=Aspartate--tRNA(Asp/Asn) ligase; AltName: Full=Aspartyl-tRNA synthetase; Short=AspRS; AltName: Full=Non-discriminating aspartyl-tRNA synthetase; Short=ND-AspRS [Geobacillus sp. WCH70]PDM41448.1 aspartate--tRNA ligase [Parageobacillus yumthangensis]RDV22163.1 aspartate--tRNA ligase [Parageobacillus toebii]PUF89918.1 aspartate--tRNA ligase [Geobacillus sp. LYN3]TXK89181.1 aspartate--tRNA ligase [Geobacillus 
MFGRTYYCGEITEKAIGEKVVLKGWVQKRRDLGGLIFIDLRDRTGIVQVVFSPEVSKEALNVAEKVRNEYVLSVEGTVVAREEGTINPNLPTGKIEIQAERITIINEAKTPPFVITDQTDVAEEVRLKYRYLDLRRPVMFRTLQLRHRVTKAIRDFLDGEGFLEVETPILTKSTPEGARDYLVPSRVHPGEFYALPQSPQIFKQLLMVAGFERYYQIARCFRDEDLRADRQPEFTQIDIETSFMSQEEIMQLTERMMAYVMKMAKGIDISLPFPRMSYDEAISRYGSDKPDTRFGLELVDVSEIVKNSSFKVFAGAIANGGQVKAINVKGAADQYSRKDIDALAEFVARYGAKGLAWLKVEEDGLKGPIAKFFTEEEQNGLIRTLEAEAGDLLLFVADHKTVVANALGALRVKLGKDLNLIDETKFNFLWITDWPLLEYDEEDGRYYAAHHPFTMPVREDLPQLETNPEKVRAQAYDLVLNGYELGGGSMRIFEREVQEKMFRALGFTEEEARKQFGFLLEAFEYGTPPHGGIALGLDRLVMLLAGRTNLRDTIAFPKTASASCLLTEAPSPVSEQQLEELHLVVNSEKKSEQY